MPVQLSYSATQKYLTSPRAYYLHYILRLRPKEISSALIFGNAFDQAINPLLIGHKNPDIEFAKKSFDNAFEKQGDIDLRVAENVKYSKADIQEELFTSEDLEMTEVYRSGWVSLRRKGHMMIEAYATQVLPRIKEILFVQKSIKLENEIGDSLIGFADFGAVWETGERVAFDNKTSSIKYKIDSARESEQLGTYFEALNEEYKLDSVGYVVIPKKIRKQKMPLVPIDVIIDKLNPDVLNATFEKYETVLNGIKLGNFECKPENCCSQPWPCPYATYCKSNGNDLTGLEFVEKENKT